VEIKPALIIIIIIIIIASAVKHVNI